MRGNARLWSMAWSLAVLVILGCSDSGGPELPPELTVGSPSLGFTGEVGEANPAPVTFTIDDGEGSTALAWSLSSSSRWLTLQPTSGTGGASVTASVDISGLGPTTFRDTITITAEGASNSPLMVPVELVLTRSVAATDRPILFIGPVLGAGEVMVAAETGVDPINLTDDFAPYVQAVAWSPDGTHIAFVTGLEFPHELYVMAADGSGKTKVSNVPQNVTRVPSWSPDGERLVFHMNSEPGGLAHQVHVVDRDGANQTNLVGDKLYAATSPHWMPTGEWIVFDGTDFGFSPNGPFRIRPDGSDLELLVDDAWAARYSPTGDSIAFMSQAGLQVAAADGAAPRTISAQLGHDHRWSPDGTRIAYSAHVDGRWRILIVDVESGTVVRTISDATRDARRPDWSPDGTSLAFDLQDGSGSSIAITEVDGDGSWMEITAGFAADWHPGG